MSLQFEDVIDCVQVLYSEYNFVFLFNHSQGHARKRNGTLSAIHMSQTYSGAQSITRDTTILQSEGHLGAYSPKLKVGDTQSFVYASTDTGPWYLLSHKQREAQRHD
jgi:hypothetical protein